MTETGEITVSVARAGVRELEAICDVDALVLGRRERQQYLAEAVRAGHAWVARASGTVAGFAVFAPSFFGQWFVELLIVHPEYRRQGVATVLVKQCEANCPADKLFTSTNESNTPMRLLLAKLGYSRSGQIENLDEGDPELIFVKQLIKRPE